jgi:hypothetical protein
MRATPAQTKAMPQAASERKSELSAAVLDAMLERISAERTACERLGDPELAQRAGRKLLTAVACAADAVLADANVLQSAPDKLAAFFEKSATACVAAIEGLHKRAMVSEAAGALAAGPRRNEYPPWGPPKTS